MEAGWSTAIQALIIAVSTVIVRVLAKKDKEAVMMSTSTPGDIQKVRADIAILQRDVMILKDAYFKANPVKSDDRAPVKPGGIRNG